jgi:hypothetical protein
MITNATELTIAVRNLKIMEEALRALREQLEASNPCLLDIASTTYKQRIASLQKDITQYLAQYPSDISLILPPLDVVVAPR